MDREPLHIHNCQPVAEKETVERREVALRLGATDVIDPQAGDVAARTFELTQVGADYAFDAVGRGALIADCVRATRNGAGSPCRPTPPSSKC